MVIVFFKYLHPIGFSAVISKAVASLKIISNCSLFFQIASPSSFIRPQASKGFYTSWCQDQRTRHTSEEE